MARETNRQEKNTRQATSGGRAGGATSPENDRSRRAAPAGTSRPESSGQAPSRETARSSGGGRDGGARSAREREQTIQSGRETGGRETAERETGSRESVSREPPSREASGRQSQGSTGMAPRSSTSQVRGPGAGGMGMAGLGTTGNPFYLIQRMAEDMDRLFEQFGFGRMGLGSSPAFGTLVSPESLRSAPRLGRADRTLWSPQVEVRQRGDDIVIRADLPGVDRDDVHVEVENDVLTIRGERREEHEEEEEGFYRSERSYGQFHRMLPLPEGVSADEVEATFRDGVLEVRLPAPKQQEQRTRRIEVR